MDSSIKPILYLVLIIFILILFVSPSKELNILFDTKKAQFISLIFGIILVLFDKYLGIIFLSAYILKYILISRENFQVVEDDVKKIVQIDRDSLLYRLQNQEEDVQGVWSASYLGKEMGLSKG